MSLKMNFESKSVSLSFLVFSSSKSQDSRSNYSGDKRRPEFIFLSNLEILLTEKMKYEISKRKQREFNVFNEVIERDPQVDARAVII